ncbi:SDR family oxidoreductase [Streptomyces sp. NPDC048278]|uniref:SDR family oxidoreductase n=1 Tax=Streptomyces sp. NPDC048278 TaxID=3155809 RepID=UPI00341948F6
MSVLRGGAGEKSSTLAIEAAVGTHQDVAAVAVTAVSDPRPDRAVGSEAVRAEHVPLTRSTAPGRDSAAVTAAFERVDRELGRLDILVNSAGINAPTPEANQRIADANLKAVDDMRNGRTPRFDYLEDTTDDEFRRVMEVNLFGAIAPGSVDTPLMRQQPDEFVQFLVGTQRIPRLATPREVAEMVVFLCDDEKGRDGRVLHRTDDLSRWRYPYVIPARLW